MSALKRFLSSSLVHRPGVKESADDQALVIQNVFKTEKVMGAK